jgi:hypothetical protein
VTNPAQKRFLVLYLVPADVIAGWMATDPAVRQPAEQKMQADWGRWMAEHAAMVKVIEGAGKTKAITSAGVGDLKNDIMVYSVVEAESHDVAAQAFVNHPHLTIPRSSIQVTEVRAMGSH